MADPVVHITAGIPDGGTGNITTLGQTLVDGANATMGVTTGAAVTTDATGTLQQYLRGLVKLIAAGISVTVSNTTLAVTQSGNWAARMVGNAGAILDFAGQNATAPANSLLVGAEFNTTPTTIASGNASPLQLDNAGNLLVNIRAGGGSGGTALADEAAFTEGTTSITPIGGVYKTSQTALTTGQAGAVALTSAREMLTEGKVWDGTNTAAVKAASTAPLATDPSLVVAISPNSVNANGQTTMSASAPVAIANNQTTLSVALDTTQISDGATGTMVTPAKAKISVASATTTTLVALSAGKKVRILSMYLVSAAANTVTLQSHTTTTNGDGGCSYAANGGISLPFNPVGWFDTTSGEALDMVTSGSGQVSGQITYAYV